LQAESEHIILFDGICNLCNRSVQFVIRQDPKKIFKFASLQSEVGQTLLTTGGFEVGRTDSFVLISKGHYYTQSTAALKVMKLLGGGWGIFYLFILVPRFIRDSVYAFIARNRYKWFGQRSECLMPTAELKGRFL
jgi:predicted DCC family thiol-disulfide oxidoreductase YuxK